MRSLFLVGFMGAGKTTVGRIVAQRLDRPFIDLDAEIVAVAGQTVDELFAAHGESGFRTLEREALARACEHPGAVVACGGGVVTDEGSHALLRECGDVVYLVVTDDEAMARVGRDGVGRPLLRGGDTSAVASLLASRERLYEAVADFAVLTVGSTPDAVAERIVTWVKGWGDA